jgi:hypothetical protein
MYTIQEHAEWAGNDEGIDQDFEADTLEEAYKIAASIERAGSLWVIYDADDRQIAGTA